MEKREEGVARYPHTYRCELPSNLSERVQAVEQEIADVCRKAETSPPILDVHWLWCFPGVEEAALACEPKAEKRLKRQKGEPISCSVYRSGMWQSAETRHLFATFCIYRDYSQETVPEAQNGKA